MKTLALLFLTVISTPASAYEYCNEEVAAKIRAGGLSDALSVNVRHMSLLELSLELTRQGQALGEGSILRPMHNVELTGSYKMLGKLRGYVKAEREKLQPCLDAVKEMKELR